MLTAQAAADKIRLIGEAEASSIKAVGKAEAEKMRLKAEAYQQYGEAAKTALVLEALPLVCAIHLYTTGFKSIHRHLGSLVYWSDYPNVFTTRELAPKSSFTMWHIYFIIRRLVFTIT